MPDTVLDGADLEGLTVRAASLRGDDHRYFGETRQDSMGLWTISKTGAPDLLLVCVADGVGSQPLSHRGSLLACRLLRDEIDANAEGILDSGDQADLNMIGRQIGGRIGQAMTNYAADHEVDPRKLSTTLVGAIIKVAPPDRPRQCVILRVGDSAAYVLRNGSFEKCLADAHDGEAIVNSATDALPTQLKAVDIATASIGNDDVLVICTDGLDNPMRNAAVRDQLADWWSRGPVPGLIEFGWQLSFRAKSYGDDRTAICVWGR
jgi:serine/threonine protein phosphatase PrpC